MNLSAPFIRRPVGTLLLTAAIAVAGAIAFRFLPVAPLPNVDYPTIRVQAQMAGASAETMAATVAAPLERRLGQIADVTEMTSTSSTGTSSIIMQFGLDRDIEAPHGMWKPRSTVRAPTCRPRCAPTPPTANSIRPMRRS